MDKQRATVQPESSHGQAGAAHRPVESVENGSMVQSLEDMKRLGYDMERVPTNSELKEEGWISDPIQDE